MAFGLRYFSNMNTVKKQYFKNIIYDIHDKSCGSDKL